MQPSELPLPKSPDVTPEQARILSLIRSLSYWLDQAFRIPGTRRRVGLDPLIGLIPGLGDLLMIGLSLLIIFLGIRVGASPWTVIRMLYNVAVEALVGLLPFFGDIFDAFWKANLRNRLLLESSILQPNRGRRDKIYIFLIVSAFFVFLGLCLWGAWTILLTLNWTD